MEILVIGGTGHIGKMLVPRLVNEGFDVTVVTRGKTSLEMDSTWAKVNFLNASYERDSQEWISCVQSVRPEVVVDILGTDIPATFEASLDNLQHFIACGSFWMYGPPKIVPTPEITQGECEFPLYARRYQELLQTIVQAGEKGIAFTGLMPSNICGPGKIPLETSGGRSLDVHKNLRNGQPVILPEGCTTLIAPCDVSDVAQGFYLAAMQKDQAAGELFNIGPEYFITPQTLVNIYSIIHGIEIPITHIDWEHFLSDYLPEPGANYHFRAHMAPDISKITETLNYQPEYTPEESLERAVEWMYSQDLF